MKKTDSKKTTTKNLTTKKNYCPPQLKEYGAIKDHTKAFTGSTGMDGGSAPTNRTMTCVSLPPFIQEHQWLLEDQYTQEKFRAAIAEKVRPGDVVLDLGTGTGLHAIFAAQAGAKKVYAVDSEAIVRFAKNNAEKNNFHQQIEFIEASSENLELPEKVDVIITNIGFFNTLKYLPQVIEKHLKPQGVMIPEKVSLEFALLQDADFFQKIIGTWEEPKLGMDFSAFKECATSRPHYGSWDPQHLMTQPQALGETVFSKHDHFAVSFQNTLRATKTGTVHGILGWYTFHLTDTVSFSTQPPLVLSPKIWNQWFLPLAEPRAVNAGETIAVELKMTTSPRFPEPIWQWKLDANQTQSTFDTFEFTTPPS